jgi:hypothetical protein
MYHSLKSNQQINKLRADRLAVSRVPSTDFLLVSHSALKQEQSLPALQWSAVDARAGLAHKQQFSEWHSNDGARQKSLTGSDDVVAEPMTGVVT